MIKINGTTITMTRGDTLVVEVGIMRGNEAYVPQEGDTVRFAMKNKSMNLYKTEYSDPEPLLVKTIPTDTLILQLDPEDTKPFGFGDYVYDIELTYADGTVDTFITEATLTIAPEVH